MKVKRHIFLILMVSAFAFINTGCGNAIENFVRREKKDNGSGSEELPSKNVVSGERAIRISAGANALSGTQVQSRVSISPVANAPLEGTQVKARVFLNRHKTN